MVWVVNRRVLIGQIYNLAKLVRNEMAKHETATEIKRGLAALCTDQDSDVPLKIVQLRGQVIDDREWLRASTPGGASIIKRGTAGPPLRSTSWNPSARWWPTAW